MKKIGIILQSTKCNVYIYETISELFKNNQVEIFFLLNSDVLIKLGLWQKIRKRIRTEGLFRIIQLVFFKILIDIEFKILSVFFKKIKQHRKKIDISEFNKNEITYLNPIFSNSGLLVSYPEQDIRRIKALNLDIIIRGNAPGIFKGDIIKSAKKGIISFHHGDNHWNRGGPPAFWEVYLRKSSTGFIIQILTEELDGGRVLFRGNLPTKRSYTENIVNLYNKSNPWLVELILKYVVSNEFPKIEETLPYGGGILRVPSLTQSISYLLRTVFLFFFIIIRRLVLRKDYRWGVAFSSGSWRNAILRKGIQIKNPPNHFFADPFVITKNDITICFVEDYSYKQKRGCITAIEIINKKEYRILGPIIEEPFHMSFPYVFEYQKELYMIPETSEANSIRLYKCIEFPLKWEYQKDILSNVRALDTMVFDYNGKWWLLTNSHDNNASTLLAYYSEQPLSGVWIAHEQNPLVFDSSISRNGGILDITSGFPIRCRQKQDFNLYGASLTLSRITHLTPSSFNEQEICQILPNFFPKIKGCHHIHSNDRYTVYDYVRFETLN